MDTRKIAGIGKQHSLDKILKHGDLDKALRKDKESCERANLNVMWYHGKITRQNAESILHEALTLHPHEDCDGMFLVRDSTASEVDFSLSFLYETRCYHYFIEKKMEVMFGIEGGPTVQGLDKLIEHYIEAPNRLPTRLTKLCKGRLPPYKVRKTGPTNLLHRAVREKRPDIIIKILDHPDCPDINEKNAEGSSALHDAVHLGLDKVIPPLLSHGADPTLKDIDGATPLHKACEVNCTNAVVHLITHDKSCLQLRNPLTGEAPLHSAALHGHTQCAEILLNAGAVLLTRSLKGVTPIEMAETYRRRECIELLETFKEPPVCTSKSDWYHPELDRQGAEKVFNSHNHVYGLFLIRPNKNKEGHVLSLFKDRAAHHYEIHTKDYRNQCVHYIDDGPFHRSLEHLVQYYHCFEDGLGINLKAAISTSYTVKELQVSETYANLSLKPPVSNPIAPAKNHPRPKLPPRPPELDSPPSPCTKEKEEPAAVQTPVTPAPVEEEQEKLQEIKRKNLKIGQELGKGEYGSVMKGILTLEKKPFRVRKEKIEVAIKTFHSVGNIADFNLEAHVMQSLKNDFIVELLGVCQGPPLMLVEEFLSMGSMLDYLEDHPDNVRVDPELYLWAAQIASGMVYLEQKRLVHRDLAARNILLKSLQLVKISDFGLSRAMGTDKDYYKASKGGRWPIKWYAPESVNFGHFSHASDVWSYGVTLWEMFSYGGAPFDDMTGVEVIKFIEDGNRLEQPEKCSDDVYEVMLQCWSYEPVERPTFSGLRQHFDENPEYMSAMELLKLQKKASKDD